MVVFESKFFTNAPEIGIRLRLLCEKIFPSILLFLSMKLLKFSRNGVTFSIFCQFSNLYLTLKPNGIKKDYLQYLFCMRNLCIYHEFNILRKKSAKTIEIAIFVLIHKNAPL